MLCLRCMKEIVSDQAKREVDGVTCHALCTPEVSQVVEETDEAPDNPQDILINELVERYNGSLSADEINEALQNSSSVGLYDVLGANYVVFNRVGSESDGWYVSAHDTLEEVKEKLTGIDIDGYTIDDVSDDLMVFDVIGNPVGYHAQLALDE